MRLAVSWCPDRKVPHDGGIIMAVGTDRAAIEAIARQDLFVTLGLADVRVIEFRASQRAKDRFRRASTANRDDRIPKSLWQ